VYHAAGISTLKSAIRTLRGEGVTIAKTWQYKRLTLEGRRQLFSSLPQDLGNRLHSMAADSSFGACLGGRSAKAAKFSFGNEFNSGQ
jgi:hypothetical protein